VIASRYSLEEQIGVGGMATVWRATDHVLDRQVAIKKLSAPLTSDPAAAERFRREAQAAAGLNHPGILVVHDAGDDDDGPWIAMELIQGETLADTLKRGPLPLPDVMAITEQVAAALDHAHQNGVIHRDIKPANLIIEQDGRVRLTDFGIAKAIDDPTAITSTGEVVGTISYMAPEILAGQSASTRSDVYSLAALVYEMISGKKPFVADTPAELMAAIGAEEPAPLTGQVDPEVVEAVKQAMDREPERRPPSAGLFAQSLTRHSTLVFTAPLTAAPEVDAGVDQEAPTVVVPSSRYTDIGSKPLGATPNVLPRTPIPGTAIVLVLLAVTAVGVALIFILQNRPELPDQSASVPATSITTAPTTTAPPTSTAPTTTVTELSSNEQPLVVAANIIDLLETMEPPDYRPPDVRDIDRDVREAVEDWEEGEDREAADHLQQALDSTRRLPANETRRQLVELLVSLAEAMGFEVERES